MADASVSVWLLALLAVFLTGVSKGEFGGGLGFLATPLLALNMSPAAAAAIMLPVLILIDQVSVTNYWRKWSWPVVWPAIVAATVGIGIGALVFGSLSSNVIRFGLGVLALGFLAFQVAKRRGWTPDVRGSRWRRAGIWGGMAGFTSTISHAGGPPSTIYLLGEKLDKTTYQASSVAIFWAVNLIKLGPYAALGVLDFSSLHISVLLLPGAIAGVIAGIFLHRRIPEWLFFRAMAVLLGITGTKLIWDGGRGLLGM